MAPSIYEHAIINNLITAEEGEYVSILEWIEQKINASPRKKFIANISYMKKVLGQEFIKKNDNAVYSSLRNIFKKYNISVAMATCKDGDRTPTMIFFKSK